METFHLELTGYLAAILTTVSFLPQAILTIRTKNTKSISLGMYSIFTIGVFFWVLYGIQKKDYAIISANVLTMVLALVILIYKLINLKKDRVKL